MAKHRIAVIVGSFGTGSINQKLARALVKLGAGKFEPTFCRIDDLPFFSKDIEKDPPEPVERIKAQVREADGVLVITPEYNRSIPGVLKNALDWVNRPNARNDWPGKPVAVAGASNGNIGTAVAQQVLRQTLIASGAVVMGLPTVYFSMRDNIVDENDDVTNEDTKKFLTGFMDKFAEWIDTVGK